MYWPPLLKPQRPNRTLSQLQQNISRSFRNVLVWAFKSKLGWLLSACLVAMWMLIGKTHHFGPPLAVATRWKLLPFHTAATALTCV